MTEKKSARIFREMAFVEELLHKSIEADSPTGDDRLDPVLRTLLHEDVPVKADNFVQCLYVIACDMTFGDWQDFWLDMGIRIFAEADEKADFAAEGWALEEDEDEDVVSGCLL